MIQKNDYHIHKFKHLKYYPKNNIDKKSIDFFISINTENDTPINFFIDKFNFYLSITGKTFTFKTLNTKNSIIILEDFYSFMFGENNFFNYSKTNSLRYKKIFTNIQNNLGIRIQNNYNFDYSSLCQEKLNYFNGWYLVNNNQRIFIDLINFYDVFGKETTDNYFEKIIKYFENIGIKTYNQILFNKLFNYLSQNNKTIIENNDIVYLMKEFFLSSENKKK